MGRMDVANQLASDVQLTDRPEPETSYKQSRRASRSLMGGLDSEAQEKLNKLRFGMR